MSNRDYYGDYTPENLSSQDKTQQVGSMQNSEFLANQVSITFIPSESSNTKHSIFSRITSNKLASRIFTTNRINGKILNRGLPLEHPRVKGVLVRLSSVEQE